MKKIFAIILCLAALTACGKKTDNVTPPPPTGAPVAPNAIKTMITPTEVKPIDGDWTTLGEVGVIIDGEYTEIILATEAERDNDGYMMWDDSHRWRLVALGETNSYSLFDGRLGGIAYIEVEMEGEVPSVKLISTSTVGLGVTEYTYSDGAFYAEEVIKPDTNGNRIYSSFPEYYE